MSRFQGIVKGETFEVIAPGEIIGNFNEFLLSRNLYVYIYVRKFDGLGENSIFIKEKFNPIYIFLFYSNITSI